MAALPQAMSNPTPTTDTCVVVRRHAADRHDVAHVAVGHQRHLPGPLRHLGELRPRGLVVRSEDLHGASRCEEWEREQ